MGEGTPKSFVVWEGEDKGGFGFAVVGFGFAVGVFGFAEGGFGFFEGGFGFAVGGFDFSKSGVAKGGVVVKSSNTDVKICL